MAPVILIIVSLSVVVVVVRKLFQNKGKLAQECQELHFLSPLKKKTKIFCFLRKIWTWPASTTTTKTRQCCWGMKQFVKGRKKNNGIIAYPPIRMSFGYRAAATRQFVHSCFLFPFYRLLSRRGAKKGCDPIRIRSLPTLCADPTAESTQPRGWE